jgi:hypothetical protein
MVRFLRDEFDLLLPAVDQATGECARDLLAESGIPSMLHSQGFEADATLGVGREFRLFVPKGTHSQARACLNAAWGKGAVARPS